MKVIKELKNKNINLLQEREHIIKENKSGKKKTEENIHIEEEDEVHEMEE